VNVFGDAAGRHGASDVEDIDITPSGDGTSLLADHNAAVSVPAADSAYRLKARGRTRRGLPTVHKGQFGVDLRDTAPAGRVFAVPVAFLAQGNSGTGRLSDRSVEVSLDDGARVRHPAGTGFVSLHGAARSGERGAAETRRSAKATLSTAPPSLVATKGAHMRWTRSFEGLDALVAERGGALLATAVLLTGSRTAGEDLLQTALERLMRNWNRVDGDREGYLRRILYNLAVDRWRQRTRRPELLVTVEPPSLPDGTDTVHLRHALIKALTMVPPKQRAVLVLRYWEQCSEAEAADVLGCSVGTVKSNASRGLARLREITASWTVEDTRAWNGATS
jgi:RNA polymerase sigma-70 factor (sigma-E family)